ncbi:YybH family protein [Sulfuriflexus mobilis]|uniref:YybH family protein n=1 Tax=Sulfuriflexus mobilis TaxID=1811807 RepID=UPI000F8429A1|nr:nuclear transport factor 2 family protein [Sulfuriflexus mobilis]
MTREFANQFALEWIQAWNSKDINTIMSHYAEDFEMTSPIIMSLVNEASGTIKGKDAITKYWSKAIKTNPNLHFTLVNVFIGVTSILINYKGHRGLSSEVLHFNANNKVNRAYAHYIQE